MRVSVIWEVDVDKGLLLPLLLPLLLLLPLVLELLIVDVGLELLDMFDDVFVDNDGVCLGGWDDCIIMYYVLCSSLFVS